MVIKERTKAEMAVYYSEKMMEQRKQIDSLKAENEGLKRDLLAIRKITEYKGKSLEKLLTKGGLKDG